MTIMDWRSMPEGKEKYAAYLCSPEWWRLRAAVKDRCYGICEKCRRKAMAHVHHQTYIRKYAELPEDLLGLCEPCHSGIHSGQVDQSNDSLQRPAAKGWFAEMVARCPRGLGVRSRTTLRIADIRWREARRCQREGRRFITLEAMQWLREHPEELAKHKEFRSVEMCRREGREFVELKRKADE